MIKIAVDNQVSFQAVQLLYHKGFLVVFRAKHEPDVVWFAEALEAGAEIFVSPDADIARLCKRHKKKFIKLDQGIGGTEAVTFIIRKLAA